MELDVLASGDFSGGVDGQEPVRIVAIAEPKSVNALTWSDGLRFEPNGMTLVYGENGSGKSGYARILKKFTRARHTADVLTDVFKRPAEQSARLVVQLGSVEMDLNWPTESRKFLSRVSFYDSDCAFRYISTETEVAYRPWAIALLDQLVGISASVRNVLQTRKAAEGSSLTELPQLPEGSRAAAFVTSISADTKSFEIDLTSELPGDASERLASLRRGISNLESGDLDKRRSAIRQLTKDLTKLQGHVILTRDALSDETIDAIARAKEKFYAARQAAEAASTAQFASEPLRGVGSESWRVLWEAARRYSEEQAFLGQHFPVLEDDGRLGRCVLWYQELSVHAAVRLRAFDNFVAGDSERTAQEATKAFERLATAARDLEIFSTSIELALQRVKDIGEASHSELRSALVALESRRSGLVLALDHDRIEVDQLSPLVDFTEVKALLQECSSQLVDLNVDDLQKQIADLHSEESELRGRRNLQDSRQAIDSHVADLKKV